MPQVEDQSALLDYDMVRVPPDELLARLQAVTNGLAVEGEKLAINREQYAEVIRAGEKSPLINAEKSVMDERIDVLKAKAKLLEQALYLKTAEMRMVGKDMPQKSSISGSILDDK